MADVQQFISKVTTDADFRHSLESSDAEGRKAVLAAAGFAGISREQIEAHVAQGNPELSEQELEAVAGGATSTWILVSLAAVALAV